MKRELPRTLYTLSSNFQQNISQDSYEVIVVDNGSASKPNLKQFSTEMNLVEITCENPTHSPTKAINLGLSKARGNIIGLCIDGARMLSPNLLSRTVQASKTHDRPVISTLAYHLGPEVQMKSVQNGYNQEMEDGLLKSVDWKNNGYLLFDISVFAGSSSDGFFMPIAESNAIFLTRQLWEELGGVDERFQTPGGGLANLDTYKRAIELPNTQLISLLGEGTFHQVHGGIATNQCRPDASWRVFDEEYKSIRGEYYSKPTEVPLQFGQLRKEHAKHLERSTNNFLSKYGV